jgi:lysozyme
MNMKNLLKEWKIFLAEKEKVDKCGLLPYKGKVGVKKYVYSQKLISFVKNWEGDFATEAYQDHGGVWTYGWGVTKTPEGAAVKPGDTITEQQATLLLVNNLDYVLEGFNQYIKIARFRQNQVDALVSLGYNIGRGALLGSCAYSYATRNPKNRRIKNAFLQWARVGTQAGVLGANRRRNAEASMYFSGAYLGRDGKPVT